MNQEHNQSYTISPLGEKRASEIKKKYRLPIPHKILSTLACIEKDFVVISVPELNIGVQIPYRKYLRQPYIVKSPNPQYHILAKP